MAMAFRIARCRERTIPRPPTSRAGRATTRRRSTPSGRTTTRTTCCGWRGSSRPRKTLVPKPVLEGSGKREGRHHRLRQQPLGDHREPRPACARAARLTTDYLRVRAYPFTQEVHDFVARHERVYVVEQNRDAQMLNLLKIDLDASAGCEAALGPALQRAADRCAFVTRRDLRAQEGAAK